MMDDINQYVSASSLNDIIIRSTMQCIFDDKSIHLHINKIQVLLWFAKTLEMKSIRDLKETPTYVNIGPSMS